MTKFPSISSIFEKKNGSNYTDNALQLQYILSYSTILNSDCPENNTDFSHFTAYQLTGWLIKKYSKFHDELTNPSTRTIRETNKIQAKLDGVESKLKEFTFLELMEQGKVHRGDKPITYYRVTESGYLLAQIIESFDETKRERANNQIYRILQRNARYDQSSYDLFSSIEYRKYKERGVFDELFTSILRDIISHSNRQINTMRDLITGSPLPNFNDEKNAKVYLEIWYEAFNELPDEESRKYCLYSLKLEMEELMESTRPKNIKDFEERRFDLRNNYDVLALEGMCSNCRLPSAISISIIKYMNKIGLTSNKNIVAKCTVCGKNCSIELPVL